MHNEYDTLGSSASQELDVLISSVSLKPDTCYLLPATCLIVYSLLLIVNYRFPGYLQ